jgi:hypothetical protein
MTPSAKTPISPLVSAPSERQAGKRASAKQNKQLIYHNSLNTSLNCFMNQRVTRVI